MFSTIYKTTLKTLFRSRTVWLALALIVIVLGADVMKGHYGYFDLQIGEMIYDTDPRYILKFDTYRENVLQNTACATIMLYPLPLFAVIATVAVLMRDYGDHYYEIEKAGNVRPISYYFARLLGIMTVVMVVAVGTTLLGIYWYVFSRGGVEGYSAGELLLDTFLRIWKYVGGMMLPVLLAIVSATLCLGNLLRNTLIAALISLFYLVANYLYCYIGNVTGWQPYFQYLSNTPSKLRWVIAAYDRADPAATMAAFGTTPTLALYCVLITLIATLLYSVVAYLRIRSREI